MSTDCAYTLGSYEPVIEAEVLLQKRYEGWRLYARHRHLAGRLDACGADDVQGLSADELADVLCALISGWAAQRVLEDPEGQAPGVVDP